MFQLKIRSKKENRIGAAEKTFNNILNYLSNLKGFSSKIIIDDTNIEITSGTDEIANSDEVVIELLIKKTIVINNQDFNDDSKLDRHIKKIQNFCDNAAVIEQYKYIPINMREKKE